MGVLGDFMRQQSQEERSPPGPEYYAFCAGHQGVAAVCTRDYRFGVEP